MFSTLRGVRTANISLKNSKAFLFCSLSIKTNSIKNIPLKLSINEFKRSRHDITAIKIGLINREFHTTKRRDIPPLLALLLRPPLRIGSYIFGRTLRKWWAKKSPAERERYIAWFRSKKSYFYGIFGGILTASFLYYVTHFEDTPITNRSRFMMFSEEQQETFGKLLFEAHLEKYEKDIVPPSHPIHNQLQLMTDHLINANQDIEGLKGKKWTLTVVDSPLRNAFVLPNRNIFIFTGIFKIVENGDQLLAVIAHEIAHVLLNHAMELISSRFLIDTLLIVPAVVISALFPDLVAGLFQLIGHILLRVFHDLPFRREQEIEADEVGLILAAKACIDVREVVVFWGLMRVTEEINDTDLDISWLSSHPNHEDREKNLNEKLPEALALRSKSQCPILHPLDPRTKLYEQSREDLEARLKHRLVQRS